MLLGGIAVNTFLGGMFFKIPFMAAPADMTNLHQRPCLWKSMELARNRAFRLTGVKAVTRKDATEEQLQ